MEAVVKWSDGSENVVLLSQIQCVNESEVIKIGSQIKMYWKPSKKWFYGTVLEMENSISSSSDSEDNVPLKMLCNKSCDIEESTDNDEPRQIVKEKILRRNTHMGLGNCELKHNKENLEKK